LTECAPVGWRILLDISRTMQDSGYAALAGIVELHGAIFSMHLSL
jgi:hypothetical protein